VAGGIQIIPPMEPDASISNMDVYGEKPLTDIDFDLLLKDIPSLDDIASGRDSIRSLLDSFNTPPSEAPEQPLATPTCDNTGNSEPDPGMEDTEDSDQEHISEDTSSLVKQFLAAEPELGEREGIQLPRNRVASKIPRATRDAITRAMRLRAERLKVALEKTYEKIEHDVADIATEFDMKEEAVMSKLQHDSRWGANKRSANLWNAVVHARSIVGKNSKTYSNIVTQYFDPSPLSIAS